MTTDVLQTLNPHWKPVYPTVLKDRELADKVYMEGYAVVDLFSDEQIAQIQELYNQTHDITAPGMFYSVYSQSLEYRQKIDSGLREIFSEVLDRYFVDYKSVLNTFIVKSSGEESEFYLHQDSTGLDEFRYTALNVWCPLVDITPDNGPMAMLKYSHWFFSPYRGISFKAPFEDIQPLVRQYLEPVYLKAGQAVIFDFRVVHNSLPNVSGVNRPVALTGIFPKEASFISCYKGPETEGRIEIFSHPDDYLLTNLNFLHNCHARPTTGEVIGYAKFDLPPITEPQFLELVNKVGLEPTHLVDTVPLAETRLISEPVFHEGMPEVHCACETVTDPVFAAAQPEPLSVWSKLKAWVVGQA
jgi:hypothetical protein